MVRTQRAKSRTFSHIQFGEHEPQQNTLDSNVVDLGGFLDYSTGLVIPLGLQEAAYGAETDKLTFTPRRLWIRESHNKNKTKRTYALTSKRVAIDTEIRKQEQQQLSCLLRAGFGGVRAAQLQDLNNRIQYLFGQIQEEQESSHVRECELRDNIHDLELQANPNVQGYDARILDIDEWLTKTTQNVNEHTIIHVQLAKDLHAIVVHSAKTLVELAVQHERQQEELLKDARTRLRVPQTNQRVRLGGAVWKEILRTPGNSPFVDSGALGHRRLRHKILRDINASNGQKLFANVSAEVQRRFDVLALAQHQLRILRTEHNTVVQNHQRDIDQMMNDAAHQNKKLLQQQDRRKVVAAELQCLRTQLKTFQEQKRLEVDENALFSAMRSRNHTFDAELKSCESLLRGLESQVELQRGAQQQRKKSRPSAGVNVTTPAQLAAEIQKLQGTRPTEQTIADYVATLVEMRRHFEHGKMELEQKQRATQEERTQSALRRAAKTQAQVTNAQEALLDEQRNNQHVAEQAKQHLTAIHSDLVMTTQKNNEYQKALVAKWKHLGCSPAHLVSEIEHALKEGTLQHEHVLAQIEKTQNVEVRNSLGAQDQASHVRQCELQERYRTQLHNQELFLANVDELELATQRVSDDIVENLIVKRRLEDLKAGVDQRIPTVDARLRKTIEQLASANCTIEDQLAFANVNLNTEMKSNETEGEVTLETLLARVQRPLTENTEVLSVVVSARWQKLDQLQTEFTQAVEAGRLRGHDQNTQSVMLAQMSTTNNNNALVASHLQDRIKTMLAILEAAVYDKQTLESERLRLNGLLGERISKINQLKKDLFQRELLLQGGIEVDQKDTEQHAMEGELEIALVTCGNVLVAFERALQEERDKYLASLQQRENRMQEMGIDPHTKQTILLEFQEKFTFADHAPRKSGLKRKARDELDPSPQTQVFTKVRTAVRRVLGNTKRARVEDDAAVLITQPIYAPAARTAIPLNTDPTLSALDMKFDWQLTEDERKFAPRQRREPTMEDESVSQVDISAPIYVEFWDDTLIARLQAETSDAPLDPV